MSIKLNERYPGRFNNPSADYPLGSFKNRTAPSAKDGSYLEQDWANDKEGFFQSLLSAAGLEPNGSADKVGASQFFDAVQKIKQSQTGTAFTTTGPSAALILTPSPPISAYVSGQRFRVKFSRASTGTDTINISGVGPKLLKQYDAGGAKVSAIFAIDQLADVEYDGVDAVLLDQLPTSSSNLTGIMGSAKNLKSSATGTSALISITADELMVENSSNQYQVLRSVSLSLLSFANAGANGLDFGAANSQTASTWYSTWVIWNGVTISGLLSLSASAPTLPSGYTHKARVGWVRTDSTANKYPLPFIQFGRRVEYAPAAGANISFYPSMSSGLQGTINGSAYTPATVAVAPFVPPTACVIRGRAQFTGNTLALLGVSAETGIFGGIPGANSPTFNNSGYSYAGWSINFDLVLRGANIYWASGSSDGILRCTGWEDNL